MQSTEQKAATVDFELTLEIQKSYNRLNKKLQPVIWEAGTGDFEKKDAQNHPFGQKLKLEVI